MNPCELLQGQIGELFQCAVVGKHVRVRTPYLYPDGDYIDLFVDANDGITTLTDLGESTRWLRMQTATARRSPRQTQMIEDICLTHGVEFFKGMLQLRHRPEQNFAHDLMRLAQAALRVSDLWFTFRTRAFESITDEVAEVLTARGIEFDRGQRLIGRSGRSWAIDFHTRTKAQSSLVCVLSTGSRSAAHRIAEHVVVTWVDLNQMLVGPEKLRFVSLFDDTFDVWSAEDFRLVENHSTLARWSAQDEFTRLLDAA